MLIGAIGGDLQHPSHSPLASDRSAAEERLSQAVAVTAKPCTRIVSGAYIGSRAPSPVPLYAWSVLPEMMEVGSRSIASVGFDDHRGLFVRLRDGNGLYLYAGVPRTAFVDLCAAESPGRFYNERIRGHFECTRLD